MRSRNFLKVMGIALEHRGPRRLASSPSRREKHSRTGARALRTIFSRIVNPIEFDPWSSKALEQTGDGSRRLLITAALVRQVLGLG